MSVWRVLVHFCHAGGPRSGESLTSWKARQLEQQQTTMANRQEEKAPALRAPGLDFPLAGGGREENAVLHPGLVASSQDGKDADLLLQEVISSTGLNTLTKGNPEGLQEVQRVIKAALAGISSPAAKLDGKQKRQEVDRLLAMATDLSEIVVRCILDPQEHRGIAKETRLLCIWRGVFFIANPL